MNILITICARGGSKGIPGKNIRLLGEKPLIAYSIERAFQFAEGRNAIVALSTDSDAIKATATAYGVNTSYNRPSQLATDSAGKIVTIGDLLEYEESTRNTTFDYILDLDVTSPLRSLNDLQEALDLLINNPAALNIFSVSPANKNPYFNMVEENEEGYFGLCKTGKFLTRQSAPKVYEMNASFYIYRRDFFNLQLTSAITNRSLVYNMQHICFDLDHEIDFEFMQYLLLNGKLKDII
jgi:CMP-N,N'-diacetyllegionaminic acid synthase